MKKDLIVHDDGKVELPNHAGRAAIWQYPGNTTTALLLAGCQEAGIRTLVEVDDNYLVPTPKLPFKTGWRTKIDRQTDQFSKGAHRRIAEFADGVIVSTPQLASCYAHHAKEVFVCPNSVDPDDWPNPRKPQDGIFRIGYAASSSHVYDAKLVHKALQWASEQPDVEVVMLGHDPEWKFKYNYVGWTDDLAQYRRNLWQLDIGVCPLQESVWHDGKSDIKAMEYAMAGAAAIVQRAEPYKPWWKHDRPCLVATDVSSWLLRVQQAVRERDAIPALAADARDYVLAERTIEKNVYLWEQAVNG